MPTCKIIIKDEVNVKIEGLELETRRRLMRLFEYEVPYARYLPAVRMGRWNGKVSFFQLGGSTYVNLLPEILPVLEQEGYDVDFDINQTINVVKQPLVRNEVIYERVKVFFDAIPGLHHPPYVHPPIHIRAVNKGIRIMKRVLGIKPAKK